jgi:cytochrome P450
MVMNKSVPEHVAPERIYNFDVFNDDQLRHDLHASYARLHREAPDVFYTPAHGGHWVITKHDAIASVVMDPEHFSVREMQIPRIPNPPRLIPLSLDPPENIPYRQILMPFFSPKSVAAMGENIKSHAKAIIGAVAPHGHCEFVAEVAARFPVTVFLEFMGFSVERLDYFRSLIENYFRARDEKAIHETLSVIEGEIVQIIELRKKDPQKDLVTFLVNSTIADRPLNMEELTSMCMLLFHGGMDTVTNAMSFGARFLAENAAIQDRLLADPTSIEPFVEESIRMFGVVNTPRLVVKDCERFGVKFRVGDMVLCNLPLAGWDSSKNPNPEIFDIDRKNRSYLMFSTGPHLCVGHFLARFEMRILFGEWMRQIGRFKLAVGHQPSYRPGFVMAMEALGLEWSSRNQTVAEESLNIARSDK